MHDNTMAIDSDLMVKKTHDEDGFYYLFLLEVICAEVTEVDLSPEIHKVPHLVRLRKMMKIHQQVTIQCPMLINILTFLQLYQRRDD